MKYPVALEFKETIIYSAPDVGVPPYPPYTDAYPNLIYDFPRLTTAYPKPVAPTGSDREICRTVNGAVKLQLLEYDAPGDEFTDSFCKATACLMGSYGGIVGTIQEHLFGPSAIGYETTGLIRSKNPTEDSLYSTANMSAGGYGFDYFSSYSNLADSIFIRVEISRGAPLACRARFLVSGFLLAGDPA